MDDIAISARGVTKCYQVFETQRARLMHALWPRVSSGMQEIRALSDISFDVRRGESVAIIGRNGGGKSTLLEIVTGTLAPTSGTVGVKGRVSALLELGSGFNPEYTGRENVILNGLLLGLARDQILARFDEILAFAEIGDAVDRPVKTYSSGMMMRLAFAVQVLTDPDILIIDEALSVGDFFFQQKCFRYIRSLCDKGVTLLFVSHDMGTVRDLCSRAIYLRQGSLAFQGDVQQAIRLFLAEGREGQPGPPPAAAAPASGPAAGFDALAGDAIWSRPPEAKSRLLAVSILDPRGNPTDHVRMGESIRLRVHFRASPEEMGSVALFMKNRYDQIVTVTTSSRLGYAACASGDAPYAVFDFDLDCMLEAGLYSLKVTFVRHVRPNQSEELDATEWFGPLRIDWDYEKEMAPFLGLFGVPVRGSLHLAGEEPRP